MPLLLTKAGKKFGKSEGNALYLNAEKTSTDSIFNYFYNTADEDVEKYWDCNRHDIGNPINFAVRSMIDGADLISQVPVHIESSFIVSGMIGPMQLAKKIHRLQKQLPDEERETVSLRLRKAYQRILGMKPYEGLQGKDLEIVKTNVENVKAFLVENQ